MGKIKIESATGAKIYIDGKDSGTIRKEHKTFEVANGTHEIYAKSAWCGSQKINIISTEDKTVLLKLSSFKNEGIVKAIFMALAGLLLFTKNLIFGILAGIVFLYPLYYLTIGKDKYLELVEQK